MSYEDLLAQTEKRIKEYYKEHRPGGRRPRPGDVVKWLKDRHPDLEALSLLGRSDLERRRVPKDLARGMVLLWRGVGGAPREAIEVVVDLGPDAEAGRLKPEELVERYDPDLQPDAFGKRLGEIARAYAKNMVQPPRVMVFDDHDKFNKDLTKKEFDRLKVVATDRGTFNDGGQLYETFAVGSQPVHYADQSPWDWQESLYKGESNAGACWGLLPLETRQVVFIASAMVKEPDLRTFRELELFDLLERAHASGKSLALAAEFFPMSYVQFKQYRRQQHLPSMKVAIGPPLGGSTG